MKRIEYDVFLTYLEITMVTEERKWEEVVKGYLKGELKRKGVSYAQLAEKLTAMGIPETERNISNKLSRGSFTAVFFVQCLTAIGTYVVRLHEAD